MVKLIFLVTCLVALVTAFEDHDDDGYDYSLATSKALDYYDLLLADKKCTQAGRMCKNCTTRVNCVEVQPGVFEEYGPHTCSPNETCKTTDCEVGRNPPCEPVAKLKFECNNIGMFPDQFDCTRLYMCAPESDGKFRMYTIQCSTKYSYNPLTTYCDTLLQPDGACYPAEREPEWPVPACEEDGQMGAILENKSIYFVCEKYPGTEILYPFLRLCAHGDQFNEELMKCEPKAPLAQSVHETKFFNWMGTASNVDALQET